MGLTDFIINLSSTPLKTYENENLLFELKFHIELYDLLNIIPTRDTLIQILTKDLHKA